MNLSLISAAQRGMEGAGVVAQARVFCCTQQMRELQARAGEHDES